MEPSAVEVGRLVLRERQSRERQSRERQSRDRQSRDRGRYADMAACYSDDCRTRMSRFSGTGNESVRRTRAMAGRGDIAVHRLGPPVVRVHGDRALTALPPVVEWRIDVDGVEADLAAACRSQYRARHRDPDGACRIVAITSVHEKDTLAPVLPTATLSLDPVEPAGYRSSYRFLSWFPHRQGHRVGNDDLGDDRPGPVAAQYRGEHAWLHRTPHSDPASRAGQAKGTPSS